MNKTPFYLPAVLAFLVAAFSCESPRTPHYYTLEGTQQALNYSTFRGQLTDSLGITPVIPVLDGDMVAGEDFFLIARGRQNRTLLLSDSTGYLNLDGHIYALNISALKNNITALSKKELGKIGFLYVDQIPSEEQFHALEIIASHNRNISINFTDLNSDTTKEAYDQVLKKLLTLFDPPILNCYVDGKNVNILENEKKLEILMLAEEDSAGFILPHMPALKTLIFIEDSLRSELLNNNPQLENLSILSYGSVDSSILNRLPQLRSLRFPFCETLDLKPISRLKKLDRLILKGDSMINVSALKDLKDLRWLHLPDHTSQDQFDSVISFHQNLKLLEINGGTKINDLSKIKDCKSLKGLIFYGDTMTEKKGMKELINLKYLSLPEDSYTDTAYLALMKTTFPNTTIVPNSGVCLGSGWILLLIPLVLIFRVIYQNKSAMT